MRRITSCETALALLAACLLPAVAAAADGDDHPLPRQGFYIGGGTCHFDLEHNLDGRSAIVAEGLDLETTARGGLIVFGYGSGPRFTAEGRVGFAKIDDGRPDTDAALGTATMDFLTTLARGRWLEPVLIVGFGVVVLDVSCDAMDDINTFGVVGEFGGGLTTHLSRHFSVSADYRYAILNFEEESRDEFDEGTNYNVGGTGRLHTVSVMATFDF